MGCEGHAVRTNTTAISDDGFKTYDEAREALFKKLMKQILDDRKTKAESNCSEFTDCGAGQKCCTVLETRTIILAINSAINPYDNDGQLAYGYDLPPLESVYSKCSCKKVSAVIARTQFDQLIGRFRTLPFVLFRR
jgi:hypothetical protein